MRRRKPTNNQLRARHENYTIMRLRAFRGSALELFPVNASIIISMIDQRIKEIKDEQSLR